MRNALRTLVSCLLAATMTINPAVACHFCGGGYSGGYTSYYYGPVTYDGGCGCGDYEVVADDCCGDCGSYDHCGCDGAVIESAPAEGIEHPAPTPPAETKAPAETQAIEAPAETQRPIDEVPMIPEEPVESTLPAEPVVPPQAPVEEPAEDNLFAPPAETPPPADTTPPADTAPAETAPPVESTPPADTGDDLFGAPAETTPPADSAPAEETPPADTAPAETPAETPAGEEKEKADDDIFGVTPKTLEEAGGLASANMRKWIDNTGTFSCHGRLVQLLDGQVRILKDNGRTTTVSLHRLSNADLEFVNRQASAQRAAVTQTAQATIAVPTIAN